MRDVMAGAFPDVVVAEHEGLAKFESIDAWVHTEIRGWTLAETIDDDQYRVLVEEARRRLKQFSDESGKVSFAAPALIATATAR